MLTADDAIRGWRPAGGDEEDVNVLQDMYFTTIKPFPASSSTFLSPTCPSLEPTAFPPQSQSIPLTPLTGVSHCPTAPSSDRRAQRNRSRDPGWIPRPRNAFIIFRCEFAHRHSLSSQESQNDTNHSAKTLSKRAADAWKQLPPSERDRFKVMADREREKHAILYPHYRFRPMKRQRSKKTPCERSQGPMAVSVERRPAPSTHSPSVFASTPQKSRSVERAEVSAPMPWVTAVPFLEPTLCHFDPQADLPVPFTVDYKDPALFYPSPEATFASDSPPPSSVELYSPLCTPTVSMAPDTFRCNDSAFNFDSTHDDLERAQALEAYAIGLYNYDLLSPLVFPE